MSILVVCPSCRKSFQVGEKFAGKSGPCPKCKATIKVPEKSQEVKIHAPQEFAAGGRSVTGQLVTKPVAHISAKLDPVVAAAIGCAALAVLALTWAAGGLIQKNLVLGAVGLLLVSPPLVMAAYAFLRNDELEPYRGVALYVRAAICAVVYAGLWGVLGYLAEMELTAELWYWVFLAPPLMIAGGLVAMGCLDLDFGSGLSHYAFYLIVTIVLRWAAGMPWIWESPPVGGF